MHEGNIQDVLPSYHQENSKEKQTGTVFCNPDHHPKHVRPFFIIIMSHLF